MTQAEVTLSGRSYTITEPSLVEVLQNSKYSLLPIRLYRHIGLFWTRKFFRPILRELYIDYIQGFDSIQIPSVVQTILETRSEGTLSAEMVVSLCKGDFQAETTATFSSDSLNFSVESTTTDLNHAQDLLVNLIYLIRTYTISTETISVTIPSKKSNKLYLSITVTVPSDICIDESIE